MSKYCESANEMSGIVKPKQKLFRNRHEFAQRLYDDTGCELFDVPVPETEEQYQNLVELVHVLKQF